jgi:hypothetical protein
MNSRGMHQRIASPRRHRLELSELRRGLRNRPVPADDPGGLTVLVLLS